MKKGKFIKQKLMDIGICFSGIFLLAFMVLIFGPAEIFFANYAEFKFVYGDFGGYMAIAAIAGSVIGAVILGCMPKIVRKVIMSVIFGISLAGYVQVMFINEGLDLLGMNPDGYTVNMGQAVVNIIIWSVFIIVFLVLAFLKYDIWKKIVAYGSVFLICIQAVALVSLTLTAEDSAYHRASEGTWFLSGEDQYTVSADKNIIVLVLDYFSNQYLEPVLEQYPDAIDCLNDFTYYNNADCAYFGTYPSLAHILSGSAIEPDISINEWTQKIWQTDRASDFYGGLQEAGYVANVYTPDKNMLCAMNGVEILEGTISNITNEGQNMEVNNRLLLKTMTKMSCYRFAPYILKPYAYTNVNEYADVVLPKNNQIYHNNHEFYEQLLEKGLTADKDSNYYIVQHLMGPHVYFTGEDGHLKEGATREETIKGCMVIVEEYLNQLKELGVYDDATIIVTADHGEPRESQVVFFMKQAGEKHDEMLVSSAPISLTDYQATIAQAAGIDSTVFGTPVTDIPEDMVRERTVWVRAYDESLPPVQRYLGEGTGSSNAYYGYKYTGDIEDLLKSYDEGPDIILPETDCYF